MQPCTMRLFLKRWKHFATIRMMTKDGSATPSVAQIAPGMPTSRKPTKVEMFTAKGPGVDSLTATKLISSSASIQPWAATSAWISGSMA